MDKVNALYIGNRVPSSNKVRILLKVYKTLEICDKIFYVKEKYT